MRVVAILGARRLRMESQRTRESHQRYGPPTSRSRQGSTTWSEVRVVGPGAMSFSFHARDTGVVDPRQRRLTDWLGETHARSKADAAAQLQPLRRLAWPPHLSSSRSVFFFFFSPVLAAGRRAERSRTLDRRRARHLGTANTIG